MTYLEDLQRICELWQERLRLRDWRITVILREADDIGGNDAHIEQALEYKEAAIKVVPQSRRIAAEGFVADSDEICIVHELLHLWFIGFESKKSRQKETLAHIQKELAINVLARVLVEGYGPATQGAAK